MLKNFFQSKRKIWFIICLIFVIINHYLHDGLYEDMDNNRFLMIIISYFIICPVVSIILYWIGRIIWKFISIFLHEL